MGENGGKMVHWSRDGGNEQMEGTKMGVFAARDPSTGVQPMYVSFSFVRNRAFFRPFFAPSFQRVGKSIWVTQQV